VLSRAKIAKDNMSSKPEVVQDISPKPGAEHRTSTKSNGSLPGSRDEQDASLNPCSEQNDSHKFELESSSTESADPVNNLLPVLQRTSLNHWANTH
jgi:hypothetical protein